MILKLTVVPGLVLILIGCSEESSKKQLSTKEVAATNEEVRAAPAKLVEQTIQEEQWAKLPAKVQQTLKSQVGQGEISSVQKTQEEGETTFDVRITQTVTRTVRVAEDGMLLGVQVFESELPAAVQRVLRAEFAKARVGQIYRETEDEDATYTTEVVENGRTNSLSIAEAGDWWSLDIDLEQAPAPAQETVRRLWGDLEVMDVSKTSEDETVAYEFEAEKDGRQHSLTIAPDGHLLAREDELELSLVPASVQKTVKGQIGNGELVRIARATNEDGVRFEIEARKNGKSLEFSVNPAGKILENEN